MSRDISEEGSPAVESCDQLIEYFRAGETPPSEARVGTEMERIPFTLDTLDPLDCETGIRKILLGLGRFGWEPELDAENPLTLVRDQASVTLEPGGQLELAGAPLASIHETALEVQQYSRELLEVCEELGFGLTSFAARPFRTVADAHWMPRERYRAMRDYLSDKGRSAHHMMVLSATIQANYDYESEAQMVELMRACLSASPIVSAMFANSPYGGGRWTGWRSQRCAMWFAVDDTRCGQLPFVYDDDFGYARYVDYVIDIPMFFVQRAGHFKSADGMTFRQFMDNGFEGEQATMADFELHLSTIFPEVRLKKFIEVRSADGGPPQMAPALAALWKGLLYDGEALRRVNDMLGAMTFAQRVAMQRSAAQDALQGHGVGWHLGELAQQLLEISAGGLRRQAVKNAGGDDESIYLQPLEEIVARRCTLADQTLERFGAGPFAATAHRELMMANRLTAQDLPS